MKIPVIPNNIENQQTVLDKKLISVMIIAYNRKEFLLDAIKSVLNQTLSKDNYEIIVIKNFEDKIIDNFIRSQNIINFYSDDKSILGKILKGIELSNCDVISFLEDDDLFINNKLEYVYNLFKNNNYLGYYHNAAQYIDKYGHLLGRINKGPGFNLSSITIKKCIIHSNLDVASLYKYTNTEIISDTFIHFCAVDSQYKIISNGRILTYYRFYKGSINHKQMNFNQYKSHVFEVNSRELKAHEFFYNIAYTNEGRKFCKYCIIGTKIGLNIRIYIRDVIFFIFYSEKNSSIITFFLKFINIIMYFAPEQIQNFIEYHLYLILLRPLE